MAHQLRRGVVAFSSAIALLLLIAPACSIDSEDCNDDDRDDECSGSFTCENAGNGFTCEKATQTCVQKPGVATCVAIPNATPERCPTKKEALAVAGCQTGAGTTGGNAPKCRGSSEDGITVVCHR